MFRRLLVAIPITALAIGGSTACATKKFVRTSVGEVNDKVDSLGRSVEETQETAQVDGHGEDVDAFVGEGSADRGERTWAVGQPESELGLDGHSAEPSCGCPTPAGSSTRRAP